MIMDSGSFFRHLGSFTRFFGILASKTYTTPGTCSSTFDELLYKVHQNLLPTSVGNYFEPDPFVNQHSYGLRSRSANLPTRIVSHTKYAEKSMQIGGLKFWNKIPEEIRNSDSLISFKRNFKKILLEFDDTDDDQIFTQ